MEAYEKWNVLSKLNNGDTVLLTNGENARFVRLKQKKFIGIINGTSYDIPVPMFKEIVEKVDTSVLVEEYKSLKKGEPFFIEQKGNALLFYFEEIKNGKIIGKNPVTSSITRIDASLYAGKVKTNATTV